MSDVIKQIIAAFPGVEFIYDDSFKSGQGAKIGHCVKDIYWNPITLTEQVHQDYKDNVLPVDAFIEKLKKTIGDHKIIYTADLEDVSVYGAHSEFLRGDGISIRIVEQFGASGGEFAGRADMIMGFENV